MKHRHNLSAFRHTQIGKCKRAGGTSAIDWGGSLGAGTYYGGTLDLNGLTVGAGVPFQVDFAAVNSTITNSSSTAASFAGNIPAQTGLGTQTAPLTVNGTGDILLSGALEGKLSLTKTGSNTLTLSGTNTYLRSTTITAGTLQLGSSAALGSSSGVSAASGAILDLDGQTIGSGVNLNNFAGTIINSSSTAASFGGTINATTSASFTVSGSHNIIPGSGSDCRLRLAGYNSIGQLTSVDNNGSGPAGTSGTPGVPDVVLSYGYDDNGNKTSLKASIGGTNDFQNTYGYNNANWLTSVTQQAQAGATVDPKFVSFAYDAAGEQTIIARFNHTDGSTGAVAKSILGHDGAGRLTSLTQGNSGSPTAYANYMWTYNAAGWVASFANSIHSLENATYSYDHDGQLTDGAASKTYSYDAAGNPTNAGDSLPGSGQGNQLLSDGTWHYYYNEDGQLISQVGVSTGPDNGHEIDYSYDVGGRLTEAKTTIDSVVRQDVHYTYDLYGRADRPVGRSVRRGRVPHQQQEAGPLRLRRPEHGAWRSTAAER